MSIELILTFIVAVITAAISGVIAGSTTIEGAVTRDTIKKDLNKLRMIFGGICLIAIGGSFLLPAAGESECAIFITVLCVLYNFNRLRLETYEKRTIPEAIERLSRLAMTAGTPLIGIALVRFAQLQITYFIVFALIVALVVAYWGVYIAMEVAKDDKLRPSKKVATEPEVEMEVEDFDEFD